MNAPRADLHNAHPEPGHIPRMLEVAELPGVTLRADEILGESAPPPD